jgi:hypothetical protein
MSTYIYMYIYVCMHIYIYICIYFDIICVGVSSYNYEGATSGMSNGSTSISLLGQRRMKVCTPYINVGEPYKDIDDGTSVCVCVRACVCVLCVRVCECV